jgi:hypothetical protein
MNSILRPTLLTVLLLAVGDVASGQTNELIGQWITTNTTTATVKRLVISEGDGLCNAQAWAECQPSDCDWGKTELKLVGDSVDDRVPRYGFARP